MGAGDSEVATPIWEEEPRGGYADVALFALSGLERLRSGFRGHSPTPPIHHLTGMKPTEFEEGRATFTMPVTPWLLSSVGVLTAGTMATLADASLGCAIQTVLGEAQAYTTAELSLTMLRPVHAGVELTCEGRLIHCGRSVALSEATVIANPGNLLVAHATSRCSVFPPLDPLPPAPAELPVLEPFAYPTPDPYLREPIAGAVLEQDVFDRMSGLEILRAQLAGELPAPPLGHLTGLRLTDVGEGTVSFALPCTHWLCPPLPRVQGGFTAMLADSALQCAIQTTVPAGAAFATLDLKVNFLRPVEPDGRDLVATGRVLHAGRTIAIAASEVTNADGKPVALATGSAMYLPGRPASLVGEAELAGG
jgi:uncharacterized protein (TIGR00369 family)